LLMDHHYSLKWNNHPANIATVFSRLREEQLFTDVTLATSDRQTILAHRVVLSAGSLYLDNILATNPSDHPTLVLSNIRYKELKLLIDFMYTGEISVDQPLLPALLEAAALLQIKGLYEKRINTYEGVPEMTSQHETSISPQPSELSVTPPQPRQLFPTAVTAADTSIKQPFPRQLSTTPPSSRNCYQQSEPNPKKRKGSFVDYQKPPHKGTDTHNLNEVSPKISPTTTSSDELKFESNKSLLGCANAAWLINASKEFIKEDSGLVSTPKKVETDNDDIPSLLNLAADRQNLLSQLQNDSKGSVQESLLQQAALYSNPQHAQIVQAMQTTYLSQLAALQHQQSNTAAQFHGSFSFATNNAKTSPQSPYKFAGLLNSAPVRRYKQYTESTLQQALKEIMEGQSINRSSMKHNIPARTLRDWMKRLNIKSVYTHNKEGSVCSSTSPEPDLNVSLEKLKSVFSSVQDEDSNDHDSSQQRLKIHEECKEINSVSMVA